jgi:hypothetical protein
MRWALALGSRRLGILNNNRPDSWHALDKECGGGHRPIVWGIELSDEKEKYIKYTTALNGHRSMILNATTNQKLVAAMEGSMEGRCDEWEARGKRNSIVLGALDVE